MTLSKFTVRLMVENDFDAVVRIDERVLGESRPGYYRLKFERLFRSGEYLPTSLVAEDEKGTIAGFIMGELYIGEYGISNEGADVDTVGVDQDFRHQGLGDRLMTEYIEHLKQLGVEKIHTLVDKNDGSLMHYFEKNHFQPSKSAILLERKI